jgi:hypothetical protein
MSAPAPSKPRWLDDTLEKLLRPVQKLPVFADERSAVEQHRRVQLFAVVMLVSLMAVMGGAMLSAGAGPDMSTSTILQVVVAVPLGIALLFYGFLWLVFVRGRRDDGDHPWRWAATKQGLMLRRGTGTVHEGTWAQWRFEGYRYMTIKSRRGVIGLEASLNGETFLIDLKRIKGIRPNVALARAVVQQLAVEGDKP